MEAPTRVYMGSMAQNRLNGTARKSGSVDCKRMRYCYVKWDLEGVRESLNKTCYGKEVTPVQIIAEKKVSNPGSAGLREPLRKATQ
ncbi:MAG: hypothetical protein ACM34H_10290 [Deltaproteobacteria bacterium]